MIKKCIDMINKRKSNKALVILSSVLFSPKKIFEAMWFRPWFLGPVFVPSVPVSFSVFAAPFSVLVSVSFFVFLTTISAHREEEFKHQSTNTSLIREGRDITPHTGQQIWTCCGSACVHGIGAVCVLCPETPSGPDPWSENDCAYETPAPSLRGPAPSYQRSPPPSGERERGGGLLTGLLSYWTGKSILFCLGKRMSRFSQIANIKSWLNKVTKTLDVQ